MRLHRIAFPLAAAALAVVPIETLANPGGGSTPRIETPRPPPSSKKEEARETDFQRAEYMIKGEQYAEAIPLLQRVVADNPRDADAWNYLGFASRKVGKLDEALGYYEKALKLDPRHKGAHEYLGELYLMMKNLPKAEEQLTLLKSICASNCEEVEDLEADIADYKAAQTKPAS
ncbi:MAG: tetratricopeptide repeat protein [Alphaproteobacteria bacterium]|nr:tetratricopeptide repeat protein [Alphaproteobacteria bacterium]